MPEGAYNLVALNLADINWLVPARKTLSVKKTGVQYRRYTDDVELIHSDLGALRNTIFRREFLILDILTLRAIFSKPKKIRT